MIQYALIRLISIILSIFPLKLIRTLKYPFGILYFILSARSTIRLIKRKKYFKENNIMDISPLIQKIYYTQYWLETIWINSKVNKNLSEYVNIRDEEKVKKLNVNNEGFIIALPHQGNWEFAIPAGTKLGLNLAAVAEPLKNKYILNWFITLREKMGCKIILGGKKSDTYESIKQLITKGYAVCLVSERHLLRSGAPELFFGKTAAFPTGPISLALEKGCPILPTTCIATNNGFEIIFGNPFYVPYFGNKAQSIQHGVKTMVQEFEYLIKIEPNQWHSTMPIWGDE